MSTAGISTVDIGLSQLEPQLNSKTDRNKDREEGKTTAQTMSQSHLIQIQADKSEVC